MCGRCTQATIKVQSLHLPMSITVLESGSMEFLFGLDMLRRYQCCIDLRAGMLRFNIQPPVELPFLAEHELPASARPGASAGAPDEGARCAGMISDPKQASQHLCIQRPARSGAAFRHPAA